MSEETIRGWKLFRMMKDGSIRSLFINKTVNLPSDQWLEAHCYPTKGFAVWPGATSPNLPVMWRHYERRNDILDVRSDTAES